MHYIGIDYHKHYSFATSIDSNTGKKKMARLSNTAAAFEAFITQPEETHVVFEASRTWPVLYELLRCRVSKVTMAHPSRVKAIASARIKTDKIDSKILAELLSADLIPEAHIREEINRSQQAIIRQRVFFVESRTRVKNRIHVLIDHQPDEVRKNITGLTDIFGAIGMEWLRHHAPLSRQDRILLNHLLTLYDTLTELIKHSNKQINRLYRQDTNAQLLGTIPGIGQFLAVLISVEIDDITRFTSADNLASYTGLVPSTYASGGITRHGHITKQGNKWLRWAFVEAAITAKKSNVQLNDYYTKIQRKKGSSKARNALARRLVKIAYSMLEHQRPFQTHMKSHHSLYTS